MSFFDAYDEAVAKFVRDTISVQCLRANKEMAMGVMSKHDTERRIEMPFASYYPSGSIELSPEMHNDYLMRQGRIIREDIPTTPGTKMIRLEKTIFFTYNYEITVWAQGKGQLQIREIPLLWGLLETPKLSIADKSSGDQFVTFMTLESVDHEEGNFAERSTYQSATFIVKTTLKLTNIVSKPGVLRTILQMVDEPTQELLERFVLRVEE